MVQVCNRNAAVAADVQFDLCIVKSDVKCVRVDSDRMSLQQVFTQQVFTVSLYIPYSKSLYT